MPEKPKTTAQMVEALWYTVVGANGHGLTQRVDDLIENLAEYQRKVDGFLPTLWTREEHDDFVRAQNKQRRSRWLALKDMILIAIGLGGFLLAIMKAFH